MARYQASVNIWALNPAERKALQPGQWITAGGARGRWAGQTALGTDVAQWTNHHPAGQREHFRRLRDFAKSSADLTQFA